jgi:hypothetical protein
LAFNLDEGALGVVVVGGVAVGGTVVLLAVVVGAGMVVVGAGTVVAGAGPVVVVGPPEVVDGAGHGTTLCAGSKQRVSARAGPANVGSTPPAHIKMTATARLDAVTEMPLWRTR